MHARKYAGDRWFRRTVSHISPRRAVFHLREASVPRSPFTPFIDARTIGIRLLFAGASRAHPSRDVEPYTCITVFILRLSLLLTCNLPS